jgi:peroxiredoxin
MKYLLILPFILVMMASKAQLPSKPEDIAPLLIGEKIPNLSLTTAFGKAVTTQVLFSKPTVLVFYRGGWCPFCTKQLAALATLQDSILALGYQIVAVSTDDTTHLQKTIEQKQLGYTLIADANGSFARAVGIAFELPQKYQALVQNSSGHANTGFLPVPTVYVVNANGEIEFLYSNPDYKKRISEKLLLAVLQSL